MGTLSVGAVADLTMLNRAEERNFGFNRYSREKECNGGPKIGM